MILARIRHWPSELNIFRGEGASRIKKHNCLHIMSLNKTTPLVHVNPFIHRGHKVPGQWAKKSFVKIKIAAKGGGQEYAVPNTHYAWPLSLRFF